MKTLPIAAAALLFGTSAYAMAAAKDGDVVAGAHALSAVESATVDWWGAQPAAVTADADADAAKADVARASAPDQFAAIDAEWDAIAAAKADGADVDTALEPEAEPVSAETTVLDEEPVPVEDGVGGPYEGVDTAAGDLDPRPAAQNYPACRPGRGDDNCIQLYEPGVRQQLASWNQPTGGFAGAGDTRVAMGGPYEAADSATETERLNQQALADSARHLEAAQLAAAEPGTADTQAAMGGPYEAADEGAIETAMAGHALAHEAAMLGDGNVDNALGETADDEALAEV